MIIVICSQVPDSFQSMGGQSPGLSDLGTGLVHNYFTGGFIIFLPQLLIMSIDRIQFLIQSQTVVHPTIIFRINMILIICSIFIF